MIRVATITTLKAPASETLAFINYHLNSGVDHMYLFFDDPEDEAIPLIENFSNLSIFRCNDAYWANTGTDQKSDVQQRMSHNAMKAFNLARENGFEWVIHIDHDEFIYGPSSVKNYLTTLSDRIEVIRFPVMEAMPQSYSYKNAFEDIRYFKVFNALASTLPDFSTTEPHAVKQEKSIKRWHLKRKIARVLGSKHVKYDLGRNFLHGHQMGKSAIKTSARIKYIDSHKPLPETGNNPEIIVSDSFYILHYDCMGFDSWKNKWYSRVTGVSDFNKDKFSYFIFT